MVKRQITKLRRFADSERAAVALEYGLIAAAMAVAIIAGMPAVSSGVTDTFGRIAAAFTP
ncbi:hypothetical protein GCM10011390_35440 [Aureimonas endophytica]|uniref:Pilus assembly protein Flp/PilA n=1 Tax=Aureimonas endophytica TaxID=2027858 RepID=A0A917E997_9HYPH|nr:Flp family type IVb pilin [Aureimonas endophytica]GGE13287.1 hypothetical protein GCM10011390_35440 [Aureimonas endophytica]